MNKDLTPDEVAPYLVGNFDFLHDENVRLFRDSSVLDDRFHAFMAKLFKSSFQVTKFYSEKKTSYHLVHFVFSKKIPFCG